MTASAEDVDRWGKRIRAYRYDTRLAREAEAQVIRDAWNIGGLKAGEIAAAYGSSNRKRVYDIVHEDPRLHLVPSFPTVLYLNGEGCHSETQERVSAAMWRRGWHTVTDRIGAWHLCRAGLFVVLVDYSCPDGQENAPWVTVSGVGSCGTEPGELRLIDPQDVARQHRRLKYEPDAPDPVPYTRGYVLDAEALVVLVADAMTRFRGV